MRKLLLLSFLFLFLVSCSNDAYETGNSGYSYLRADFVEAKADEYMRLVSAVTDNDVSLSFEAPVLSPLADKADSTYRALLYYNMGETTETSMIVQPVRIDRVYVLNPIAKDSLTSQKTSLEVLKSQPADPVHFQSAWLSANASYANLGIALMTGIADSVDNRQAIALRCDTVVRDAGGHSTYYYTLLHSQGDVPQYYKTNIYISIPTKKMTTGDIVRLSLNTFDGWVTREFRL